MQICQHIFTVSERQHPYKTLIGRTERGFDFLGYRFEPGSLPVADQTVERFKEHITRLYEQGADAVRIGQYVLRWLRWVVSGMYDFTMVDRSSMRIPYHRTPLGAVVK